MYQHPRRPLVDLQPQDQLLLLAAGLALFFFVLEYSGTELMLRSGLIGQIAGFLVAYALPCALPIVWGWWMIHDRGHRRLHPEEVRRRRP
jgi:hypothetical protein